MKFGGGSDIEASFMSLALHELSNKNLNHYGKQQTFGSGFGTVKGEGDFAGWFGNAVAAVCGGLSGREIGGLRHAGQRHRGIAAAAG